MKVFDFNNPDLYFLIVLTFINAFALCLLSNKFLQIIQLSDYKIGPYGTWLKDTKAKWVGRITILAFLSFCCVYVTTILFNNFLDNKLFGYLGLIFYFSFVYVFVSENHKIPQKKPLQITKRMFRLYCVLFLIYALINFVILATSLSFSYYLRVSAMVLTPILVPIMVPFAVILVWPLERLIYLSYKKRCKKELKKHQNLIIVGITGSFGKTSTKNYLAEFLKTKYKVCATPSSYNTQIGICKTVHNFLKPDDEIFIAEMGAKRVGDIKEICDMIKPNHGIVTAIGEQHLETFKSLDNIIKTKGELVDSLVGDDCCVFNVASENTKKLYDSCTLKNKIAVGITDTQLFAKNIVATQFGLNFTIVYQDKSYKAHTQILGEHNVQNILCAIALALKLGISIKTVLQVLPTLKPVEHRLELKHLDNNILIIDDSFNSNIQGTAVALKTLKLFETERKIVVTPGLVELGKMEDTENYEFGKRIAKVADIVILVGKNQSQNIKNGLLKNGFDPKNIYMQDSLFEVTNMFKTLLKSGDVVLLENDLPDNYK